MDTVFVATGNPWKLEAAKHGFQEYDIDVEQLDVDLPEIQADTVAAIAEHTAVAAAEKHNVPVIREDHGVHLDALHGAPGPYMNYFNRVVPPDTLLTLLDAVGEWTGYFELGTVLATEQGEIIVETHELPIEIADTVRGSHGDWRDVLQHRGDDKTFAEAGPDYRLAEWSRNFQRIAEHLHQER